MNDTIQCVNDSYSVLATDYTETGPLEIAVTFSNNVCSKTTAINYRSKSLLLLVISDMVNNAIDISTLSTHVHR